jgi:hypothetical protein
MAQPKKRVPAPVAGHMLAHAERRTARAFALLKELTSTGMPEKLRAMVKSIAQLRAAQAHHSQPPDQR